MTNTSQNNENTYFNIHTSGIGYLSRIRTVEPKKGDPFLCCTIAALVGPSNQVEYRYFDLRVSGEEAKGLIARCQNAVEAEKKVIIGFRLGDLWVDQFVYEKGNKKGQTGYTLKGRLLKVNWIKIDGKIVYQAKTQTQEDDAGIPADEPQSNSQSESQHEPKDESTEPQTNAQPVDASASVQDESF
ncbi:MAG: STY4534 family ICE replication protein [Saezia sp.]